MVCGIAVETLTPHFDGCFTSHAGVREAARFMENVSNIENSEIFVRVLTTSVNPVDIKTREGKYRAIRDDKLPFTLGRDFEGVLERVGQDVKDWQQGDEVIGFGSQWQGALAGFVVTEAQALAGRPTQMEGLTAAAVPLAALTARQELFDHGGLQAGERVLIHAGAGGVGPLAVQFARHKGAEVVATGSADSIDFVKSPGAARVIDYRKERFEDVAQDVDPVFDLIGGETQERLWKVIKHGGTLIVTLTEASAVQAAAHGAHGARWTARPDGRQLAEMAALIESGDVRVSVVETFTFDKVAEALAKLEKVMDTEKNCHKGG